MKKFLFTLSLLFFFMIILHNDQFVPVNYSIVLENPPSGYSPSGEPVIVAQGIIRPDDVHVLPEFVDCPNPILIFVWEFDGTVVKYMIPPEISRAYAIIARPLSFICYGEGERDL